MLLYDSCKLAVKKDGEDHIMVSFKTVPQSLPKRTDDNEKPPLR